MFRLPAPQLIRARLVWVLMAGGEVRPGALRIKRPNRPGGDRHVGPVGVGTGSALNFARPGLTLPWLGAVTTGDLLTSGGLGLA